jgi:hypothetical protein
MVVGFFAADNLLSHVGSVHHCCVCVDESWAVAGPLTLLYAGVLPGFVACQYTGSARHCDVIGIAA